MNNINNVTAQTVSYLKEIIPFVSERNQKLSLIAMAVFASLAACYAFRSYLSWAGKTTIHFIVQSLNLFYEGPQNRESAKTVSPEDQPFEKLSDEIVIHIFKQIPSELRVPLNFVSRRFKGIANDKNLVTRMVRKEILKSITQYAGKINSMTFAEWLLTTLKYQQLDMCVALAEKGYLNMLALIYNKKRSSIFTLPYSGKEKLKIGLAAVRGGHLNVLQWARQNGCRWDREICAHAAANGHLDLLQWARQNGCPWDELTCISAANYGHLDVLQWAHQNGCPWSEQTCAFAARNGHLEVLQWARQNGCPWWEWTCTFAASNGHLHVLQWARQNGCPWWEWTCTFAASNGHLHVLQWARQNGCPWDRETCAFAAKNGHLDVLQWARQNGCPWNAETCSEATKNGHLDVLQWARQNGCPWNAETCSEATKNGHFGILQWARQNGCPWDKDQCLLNSKKYPEIQKWINEN